MMDLRSASRVLRPRQFQEIKVMKSSHVLLARSQKTKVWATDRPSDFRRLRGVNVHDIVSHVVEIFREVRPLFFFVGLHPRFL
ncbi:hypothetical protein TNCV_970211 [Trichonephila clavipes]|nr:hypothetical protein TNCV_970211 [Trichonephila clavipes]